MLSVDPLNRLGKGASCLRVWSRDVFATRVAKAEVVHGTSLGIEIDDRWDNGSGSDIPRDSLLVFYSVLQDGDTSCRAAEPCKPGAGGMGGGGQNSVQINTVRHGTVGTLTNKGVYTFVHLSEAIAETL
jgi:hypothetical protein